jgi:phosphoribosylpyrophosphate synthetase
MTPIRYFIVGGSPEVRKDWADLARQKGLFLHELCVEEFPNGEIRIQECPEGITNSVVFQLPLGSPNTTFLSAWFLHQKFNHPIFYIPALPYSRNQDALQVFYSPFRTLVTLDFHDSQKIPSFIKNLWPTQAFAEVLQNYPWDGTSPVIVAPDEGARLRAQSLAQSLGVPFGVGQKKRNPEGTCEVSFPDLSKLISANKSGNLLEHKIGATHNFAEGRALQEKPLIFVDDWLDTGQTLIASVQTLKRQGKFSIIAAITHCQQEKIKQILGLVDHLFTFDVMGRRPLEKVTYLSSAQRIIESLFQTKEI